MVEAVTSTNHGSRREPMNSQTKNNFIIPCIQHRSMKIPTFQSINTFPGSELAELIRRTVSAGHGKIWCDQYSEIGF
jgi:hypothetical protein